MILGVVNSLLFLSFCYFNDNIPFPFSQFLEFGDGVFYSL